MAHGAVYVARPVGRYGPAIRLIWTRWGTKALCGYVYVSCNRIIIGLIRNYFIWYHDMSHSNTAQFVTLIVIVGRSELWRRGGRVGRGLAAATLGFPWPGLNARTVTAGITCPWLVLQCIICVRAPRSRTTFTHHVHAPRSQMLRKLLFGENILEVFRQNGESKFLLTSEVNGNENEHCMAVKHSHCRGALSGRFRSLCLVCAGGAKGIPQSFDCAMLNQLWLAAY